MEAREEIKARLESLKKAIDARIKRNELIMHLCKREMARIERRAELQALLDEAEKVFK